MSLRVRLTLWVAFLSLIVVAILAGLTYFEVRDAAIDAIQAEMVRVARVRAQDLRDHGETPAGPNSFVLDPEGRLELPPSGPVGVYVQQALENGLLRPGDAGVVTFQAPDGETAWFALQTAGPGGQTAGVVLTRRQALEGLDLLREEVLVVHLAGSAFLALLVWLAAGGVTRPLVALEEAARKVARGDLDVPVPRVRHGDEVAALAASFARMQEDLKTHIADLRAATAEHQRIASELAIGTAIQRSFLPDLEDGREVSVMEGRVDLAAVFRPAREMAGDLYDYFSLGPHRLGVVIGDVSGKGMPAALFMAVAHTLVRSVAPRASGPADCLQRVNRLLCAENRAGLFVTLHHGVLDLEAGRYTYASGGHSPPVVGAGGRAARSLPLADGMVLGVAGEVEFLEQSVPLGPGETLLLYTDGLDEASDPRGEQFGEERILQLLEEVAARPLGEGLLEIVSRAEAFTDGKGLSDDLTVLALRFKG